MRWEWRPYVTVAQRRAKAHRHVQKLQKQGKNVHPIEVQGRKIARTFWGQAWCENLESYSDFANRLPRGRTYVRNGSVVDLQIAPGQVEGIVSGSDIYKVKIQISATSKSAWDKIKRECSGSIDSLMDLLQGRFAESVMAKLTRQDGGLFPQPKEIKFRCSCPDWARMCKHVAAVFYGIGARLDDDPELLFVLRGVDHLELIAEASTTSQLESAMSGSNGASLDGSDLESVFGIDLDDQDNSRSAKKKTAPKKRKATKPATKKATTKRTTSKSSPRRKPKKASTKKPRQRVAANDTGSVNDQGAGNSTPKKRSVQKTSVAAKSKSQTVRKRTTKKKAKSGRAANK